MDGRARLRRRIGIEPGAMRRQAVHIFQRKASGFGAVAMLTHWPSIRIAAHRKGAQSRRASVGPEGLADDRVLVSAEAAPVLVGLEDLLRPPD